MRKERIDVQEVAHHRNGICGMPFYAVTFLWTDEDGEVRPMLATVFTDELEEDEEGLLVRYDGLHNPRVAVLSMAQLPSVTFAENSWRGDHFADALYEAINKNIRETAVAVGTWEG